MSMFRLDRAARRTALPGSARPGAILRELPERERENFLSQYREALDGARDPAGWKHLRRVLRMWSWMVIVASQPGHYEAREQALAGTGEGMLLEETRMSA
jgi:hypothetical protein